jgi:hypothetical protein
MTRAHRYPADQNPFIKNKPRVSIMQALETAVLLMEQAGCTEEDIFKYVHMIHMGWIRDGSLAPEYLALVAQVEAERQAELAAEARAQAVRDSVVSGSTIITQVGG